jgi:hypothetical protein
MTNSLPNTSGRLTALQSVLKNTGNLPAWLILALLIAVVGWVIGDSIEQHPWIGVDARDAALAEGIKASRIEAAKLCWDYSRPGTDEALEAAKGCFAKHVR